MNQQKRKYEGIKYLETRLALAPRTEQPFLLPAELLPEEQFSTNESPVLLNSQDSIKHT